MPYFFKNEDDIVRRKPRPHGGQKKTYGENLVCRKLGERIREIRKNQGWSIKTLCNYYPMGLNSETWSRVELGKSNIQFSKLCMVAVALGHDLSTLLEGFDPEEVFDEYRTPNENDS